MRRWNCFRAITSVFSAFRLTVSFRKTRDVQMVPTVDTVDLDTEWEGNKIETALSVDNRGGDDSIETDMIEFGAAEMDVLPKSHRKILPKTSSLTAEERQRLTQMIFNAHYKAQGDEKEDRAMWYQSALELHWLEEWAASVKEDTDEIRRAIKRAVLERVDLHKPLAYIIGHQPFYGCHIRCFPPLLCPRPETEMWTHWFVRQHLSPAAEAIKMRATHAASQRPLRVLDMCCGTGCIGIAIAVHVPNAEVVAIDIMDEAVKASEENAKINGLDSKRYRAIKSDMFEFFFASDSGGTSGHSGQNDKGTPKLEDSHLGSFDCIVSNPPYVLPQQYVNLPCSVKLWETKLSLVGDANREHQQYLYFQELCELGAALLKSKSRQHPELAKTPNFIVEVGLQAEVVASIMEKSGLWENVEIHLDYMQQMRWISATSSH